MALRTVLHLTVRRSAGRFRLWAEEDGSQGTAVARANTLAALRRNAERTIRREWVENGFRKDEYAPGPDGFPVIEWHRSTRAYAKQAARMLGGLRPSPRKSR